MLGMRIVSRVVAIIGAIALVAGVIFLSFALFEIWKQWVALSANRSRDFLNPVPNALTGVGIAVLGSFILGLGIGLPKGKKHAEELPPATTAPPVAPSTTTTTSDPDTTLR